MSGAHVTESEHSMEELRARVAKLESALASERALAAALTMERAALTSERDRLRLAYQQALEQLQLLRRRIFVASAERVDTRQLELEFASKQAELEKVAGALGLAGDDKPKAKPKAKPKGRRNLSKIPLEEERCEILDPELEGKFPRIGFEESSKLGYKKGGPIRIVIARAKYRLPSDDAGERTTKIVTVPLSPETLRRTLAAPSLLAKIAVDKFADGLPLYRQEGRFAREGIELDRATMCRWMEDIGMTLGGIVIAMRGEALSTAFCIATDATGIAVQPEPDPQKGRRPCRRGHFFTLLADRDHVLFEYEPKETSAAVERMFHGYSGYIQADAKSVYDILFRKSGDDGDDDARREEVACWAHARRKFYEAAIMKDRIAREALFRIHKIFEFDQAWSGLPPSKRKALRLQYTKDLVDDFFAWAEIEYEKVKGQRGWLRSAFGYAIRQKDALCRFLDDGRLKLDNNASERELRRIAVGRKAWLFVGSDDHAEAAANIFSLIASCKLHRLDPEAYLRDVIRVFAHWPRDRYLELAPRYWAATSERLDPTEIARPAGPLSVPPPPAQEAAPG